MLGLVALQLGALLPQLRGHLVALLLQRRLGLLHLVQLQVGVPQVNLELRHAVAAADAVHLLREALDVPPELQRRLGLLLAQRVDLTLLLRLCVLDPRQERELVVT